MALAGLKEKNWSDIAVLENVQSCSELFIHLPVFFHTFGTSQITTSVESNLNLNQNSTHCPACRFETGPSNEWFSLNDFKD